MYITWGSCRQCALTLCRTLHYTVSHYNIHRELQYKRFSNFYFMELLKCKPLYFTWRSTIESKTLQVKDLMGLQTMLEKAMNQKSFIRLYRSDPAMYSTVPATKITMYSIFIIKEFQAAFWTRYCSVNNYIILREFVYSVRLHCAERALKHKCFIRLNRSDPAMYSTVPATIM